jgi:hypothetical protein
MLAINVLILGIMLSIPGWFDEKEGVIEKRLWFVN